MNVEEDDLEIEKIRKRIKFINTFAWIFVALGLAIFCAGIDLWYNKYEELNEIGDFVGGIGGSLWALAGLFFIYIAFLGQRIEIKLQQKDIKDSRLVFIKQAQIMSNQQLDNTFFNLIDNHRKLVDSFKKGERNINNLLAKSNNDNSLNIVSGYEVLENKVNQWKTVFENHSNCFKYFKVFDFIIPQVNPYELVEKDKDVELLHSDVIEIMKFVKENMINNNADFYIRILRNNLSFEERFLVEVHNYFLGKDLLPYIFNEFNHNTYSGLNTVIKRIDFVKRSHTHELYNNFLNIDRIRYDIFNFENHDINSFKLQFISSNSIIQELNRKNNLQDSRLDLINDFDLHDGKLLNEIFDENIFQRYLVLSFRLDAFTYYFDFGMNKQNIDRSSTYDGINQLDILFNRDDQRKNHIKKILN